MSAISWIGNQMEPLKLGLQELRLPLLRFAHAGAFTIKPSAGRWVDYLF
jgi:hypothetical protein